MTIYLINFFEAYRADENTITADYQLPNETSYYKYEILDIADVALPQGYVLCDTAGNGKEIYKGNKAAEMVTEHDGTGYITTLVTSDGIVELHKWNYGR